MKISTEKKYLPYLLMSPVLIFYALFWIRPVLTALIEAFSDLDGNFSFENFITVSKDPIFWTAVKNSALFTIISAFLQFILGFSLALFLNRSFRGSRLVLFLALIPMAIPPTAVAILWQTGFQTLGWVNSILVQLKIIEAPISWLTLREMRAIILLIVIDTWTVLPSVMIIIYAGLQNLNKEYEEAAFVFGATKLGNIVNIVYPILKPSIVTAMILRIIASIQIWLLAVMMFGYGRVPFMAERIAYYTEIAFTLEDSLKLSYTYSIIITLIVMTTSSVYLKLNRRDLAR